MSWKGGGAITMKHGILPGRPTLFSKRGVYVSCEKDTIDERMVTNYFPEPGYYSYLNMALVVRENSGPSPAGEGDAEASGNKGGSNSMEDAEEEEEEEGDGEVEAEEEEEEEEVDSVQYQSRLRSKKPRLK